MNVLNLEHISKIYGDKVIFDDISCGIHQGDKIGIIGINGTGKTTFLRILAGLEEADDGQVIMQNGLRISFLSQHPTFPEGATILSYVTQGQREQSWNPETEAHMVLNKLGIEDHEEEIAHLSGGQKKRVALAAVLVNPTDVLILDEPTNHLDITSKEILEEALNNYSGTILYVSHDRYFINQTASRILELVNQTFVNYIGNYDYYLEKKEALTLAYASGNETNAENVSNSGNSAASTPASDSKLSWQEQKEQQARERKRKNELKKTEEEIAKLEDRNTEIDEELTKEEVYSNSIECQKLSTERAANEARLEELYELWEELAE